MEIPLQEAIFANVIGYFGASFAAAYVICRFLRRPRPWVAQSKHLEDATQSSNSSIEAGDAAVPYHDDGDGAVPPPTAKHFDLASNDGFQLKKAIDEAKKKMEISRLAQLHKYRVKAKDKEASSMRSMTNALYAGSGPCQRRNDSDGAVRPEDWCFSRLVADPQPLHGVFELGQSSYTKYNVDAAPWQYNVHAAPLHTFLNLDFSSFNTYQG